MKDEEAKEYLRAVIETQYPDTDPVTEAWLIEEVLRREMIDHRRSLFYVVNGGREGQGV